MLRLAALALTLLTLAACTSAGVTGGPSAPAWNGPAAPLAPFLDDLFAYRPALESADGGSRLRVPFDEARDVNGRDTVPVRKVRSNYVRPLPGPPADMTYAGGSGPKRAWAVGGFERTGLPLTVVYLHGRGGNRDWGVDDDRFGGNFNRLKNLVTRAGGLYVSPDFTDFDAAGTADIRALLTRLRGQTSGRLVLACGSMGSLVCWRLASDPASAALLDGMVVLSGVAEPAPLAAAPGFPLLLAHGSADSVYAGAPMRRLYERLKGSGARVRLVAFDSGGHGAPLRMVDWRDTLNWIMAQPGRPRA